MKQQKWHICNDQHFPFEDKDLMSLQFAFLKREQPNGIALLGDVIDMYQISRFNKDPERRHCLQSDIDETVGFLRKIRKICPNAKIIYIQGDHALRLRKYLLSTAPELAGLRTLRFEHLLGLKELNITYAEEYKIGDLFLFHGDIVRKHAGYSAKAMYEKHGVSLIHGHTHRDGKYAVRNRSGHFAVWENYCQCDLFPEYVDYPNWSQGWSMVTVIGKRPYVEQIAVINGSYIYGGKKYGD